MNIIVILWIIVGILGAAIPIGLFFAFFDFRAWMIRRVGPDYRRGLAHIKVQNTWVYRESDLIYEGDTAMTYIRRVTIDGKKTFTEDIVPHSVGFTPDEYTGARVYRVQPGGSIATSDDGDPPKIDYPAKLLSHYILGRTAIEYAQTVKDGEGVNFRPLVIGAVVLVIVGIIVLFATGIIPSPLHQLKPATGTTANITQTIPQQGPVYAVPDAQTGGK